MNKTVSAGVLVINKVDSLLVTHPTGSKFFNWKYNEKTSRPHSLDIPKGMIEEGEDPAEAAARELFEETGVAVDPSELIDLGRQKYVVNKDLHLFYIRKDVDLSKCECTSYFENAEGEAVPEANGYAFITLEQSKMLYKSLENVVKPLWSKVVNSNRLVESSKDIKTFCCTCVEAEELFDSATDMAFDLGYYATFDDFEDPDDSNYIEITADEFYDVCPHAKTIRGSGFTFLRRFDDSIYCLYSDDDDVHYFYT